MRRADRLFQIVNVLRRRRTATTATHLADRLGVSARTVYRDIRDLILAGTPIDGEAGVGYRIRPGYDLPPLMFDRDEIQALVLGGHGDQMVPVVSATTVGGVPLRELVSEERIQQMVERTAKGGGEIVQLLGTSAWYAPGAAIAEMVDAILLDQKRVLPCTALLEGEYGINGLFMGVPVKLGSRGAEQIIEIKLTPEEKTALEKSANSVRSLVKILGV